MAKRSESRNRKGSSTMLHPLFVLGVAALAVMAISVLSSGRDSPFGKKKVEIPDRNNDGKIDSSEVALHIGDLNGDGRLDAEEIKEMIAGTSSIASDQLGSEPSLDFDGDGDVDLQDVEAHIKRWVFGSILACAIVGFIVYYLTVPDAASPSAAAEEKAATPPPAVAVIPSGDDTQEALNAAAADVDKKTKAVEEKAAEIAKLEEEKADASVVDDEKKKLAELEAALSVAKKDKGDAAALVPAPAEEAVAELASEANAAQSTAAKEVMEAKAENKPAAVVAAKEAKLAEATENAEAVASVGAATEKAKMMFSALDKDGDKNLSIDEMKEGFKALMQIEGAKAFLPEDFTVETMDDHFKNIDTDGSGGVSEEEWLKYVSSQAKGADKVGDEVQAKIEEKEADAEAAAPAEP